MAPESIVPGFQILLNFLARSRHGFRDGKGVLARSIRSHARKLLGVSFSPDSVLQTLARS